jgi:hypothetical protein
MSQRILVALAALLGAVGLAPAAEQRTVTLDPKDFLLSPEVVLDPTDGSARLAHSVLIADEMGATDFRQVESLSERVWARKALLPEYTEISRADLFVFGSPKVIEVNGRTVKSESLFSTGWLHARVPPDDFRPGGKGVIMRGGGQVLFEPGRRSMNSHRSTTAGQEMGTGWGTSLGPRGDQQGEYLVRLRVDHYARSGWALSPVFDLWACSGGEPATPGRCVSFANLAALEQKLPGITLLVPLLRTGSTPTPDDSHWSGWTWLTGDHRPQADQAGHRWAQIKIELNTVEAQTTPRLKRFNFVYDIEPLATDVRPVPRVSMPEEARFARSPVPFTYQEPSPRLKLLRERYQLDKVIAPGKTEMEQLMLLRHWVRNQWHTAWGSHPASWMPPWDALVVLESKDQPDCLTMCTHYAAVFTQCCLALGWNARHCILDHHCVSEVWVDQHRKWVMMDAGNSAERADVNLHFERNGLPLSALELHRAYHSGKTDGITIHFTPARLVEQIAPLCRPAPQPKKPLPPRPDTIPLAELTKYPVCQLNNYRRYAFPARNNYLASLLPGELYQGWSEYFYDGYWWVGDSPDDPKLSPEYSRHLDPGRPQDIDWSLNWCRIHLCRTAQAGELKVDVETFTPNLARLEKQASTGDAWQATPAAFVWKLKPGENVLRVRSVNQWERAGTPAEVKVQWSDGGR